MESPEPFPTLTKTPDAGSFAVAEIEQMPRLTFDLDVDVCVIGGGMAGLCVARELARRGESVALVEAQRLAWGASSRNNGLVMPGYAAHPQDVVARVGMDHARELWTMAGEGANMLRAYLDAPDMAGVRGADGWLQASRVDSGDEVISRIQVLGEDFGMEVEGWQRDQVRAVLNSDHYFHALHFPKAMNLDPALYARGLVKLAQQAGVRMFEETPVVGVDAAGIRKRITTGNAKLRAYHIVLAGNVHLGPSMARLAATLLPLWRSIAITEPMPQSLADAIRFAGTISGAAQTDEVFRVVNGNRLMWSSRLAAWDTHARDYAPQARKEIIRRFPQLTDVAIARTWSAVAGHTVHGMPQIGEIRSGVWVASGFGQHGLNVSALAAQLVADGITARDDRWRLFSPFELVWAGGPWGRIIGQGAISWLQLQSEFGARMSRYREQSLLREKRREMRLASATEAARKLDQQTRAASGDGAARP